MLFRVYGGVRLASSARSLLAARPLLATRPLSTLPPKRNQSTAIVDDVDEEAEWDAAFLEIAD